MRAAVTLVIVLAACGGGSAVTDVPIGPTAAAPATTAIPITDAPDAGSGVSTTVASGTSAETGTPEAASDAAPPRVRPEGPDAPDFELALGQGGVFSLSAEQRPVYMVFWAEW